MHIRYLKKRDGWRRETRLEADGYIVFVFSLFRFLNRIFYSFRNCKIYFPFLTNFENGKVCNTGACMHDKAQGLPKNKIIYQIPIWVWDTCNAYFELFKKLHKSLFILQPHNRIRCSFCNLITGSGIHFATSPDPVFILLPNHWIQYSFWNLITESASSLNFILCPFHDFFIVNFATHKELFENTNKTFITMWIRINFCFHFL